MVGRLRDFAKRWAWPVICPCLGPFTGTEQEGISQVVTPNLNKNLREFFFDLFDRLRLILLEANCPLPVDTARRISTGLSRNWSIIPRGTARILIICSNNRSENSWSPPLASSLIGCNGIGLTFANVFRSNYTSHLVQIPMIYRLERLFHVGLTSPVTSQYSRGSGMRTDSESAVTYLSSVGFSRKDTVHNRAFHGSVQTCIALPRFRCMFSVFNNYRWNIQVQIYTFLLWEVLHIRANGQKNMNKTSEKHFSLTNRSSLGISNKGCSCL